MAGLTVNIDHVATLREIRKVAYPDPIASAVIAELAGADGISVRLREDRCHIQDRDVRILREVVQTRLIMQIVSTPGMVGIALDIKPDIVTVVPKDQERFSTDGGLDLIVHKNTIAETVATLQNNGISVSVFIDPEPEQIKLAHQINANTVEIYAGAFCTATSSKKRNQAFSKIVDVVKLAKKLKLNVGIGRGLCYNTIKSFKGLYEIDEYYIGHSIISKAVLIGMEKAVREMLVLITNNG